jgi:hypothetical protein
VLGTSCAATLFRVANAVFLIAAASDEALPMDRRVCSEKPHQAVCARCEAVILGVDGISDFNALCSGKHNEEVQLCAFDVLALDGDDLCRRPLSCASPISPGSCAADRRGSS